MRVFKSLLGLKHFFGVLVMILSLLGSWVDLKAQDVLDSLQVAYEKTLVNSPERFSLAGRYITALFFNEQQELSQAIFDQNIEMAQRLYQGKYACYLYAIQAMNHRISENYIESQKSLELAQEYEKHTTDLETKGYVAYAKGWLLIRNNQEGEGIRSLLQALDYYDKSPDSELLNTRKSTVYHELTAVYSRWGEFELQEKYSQKALELAILQNDQAAIFNAYMLMGNMYEQSYDQQQGNENLLKQAESYYLKAVDTYMSHKSEIPFASHLSFVANNLASLYLSYFPDSYSDKVLYYANIAIEQGIKTQQYSHVAAAYGIKAEIALFKEDITLTKEYLLLSLKYMQKSSMPDVNITLSILQSLSDLSETQGDYKQALAYTKDYLESFKALYNQEQLELSKRLEAQFNKQRQEQEIVNMGLLMQKKQSEITLMTALAKQQSQEFENLKLVEENQRKELALSQLESQKRAQELKLTQLQSDQAKADIQNYKQEIKFKEKINGYYITLIGVFFLGIILLIYAYKQRVKAINTDKKIYEISLAKTQQQAKIQNLTAMLEGQEKERGRMARDLHDGLGGLLSSTKISLSSLIDKVDPSLHKDLDKTLSQLDISVEELRRIAHNLMPDLLQRFGLKEALNDYAQRMRSPGVDIDVQFLHYDESMEMEKQLIVYRIVQELVNNALKHAKASLIIIQLVQEKSTYILTVEDDGQGFLVDKVKLNSSAGMFNINSRIDFLKGTLSFNSQIDVGTSIEITFPKTT